LYVTGHNEKRLNRYFLFLSIVLYLREILEIALSIFFDII
jgi:hypothetical protein